MAPESVFVFISRLNFTIEDRDISCPAHKHFIDRLSRLKNRTHINEDGNKEFQFAVTPIHVTFPQYFDYERVKELVSFSCEFC